MSSPPPLSFPTASRRSYRVGALYTHNAALLEALSNVNYFSTVSNDTQDLLAAMMEDAHFVDGYLAHCRAQLRAASRRLTAILDAAEVPYVAPRAGMFIWIDLRAYLPPLKSVAASHGGDVWARERALTDALFAEERILFTPGGACHAGEPGWYRCCFAWMHPDAVAVGFHRLAEWAVKHPQHRGTTPATPALLELLGRGTTPKCN
jgi:DNA-binding transcriptional MocR family regulator